MFYRGPKRSLSWGNITWYKNVVILKLCPRWGPQFKYPVCDNVLPGQDCRIPQGAMLSSSAIFFPPQISREVFRD
jgi:hypothetical protein